MNQEKNTNHLTAVLQALFVTILWSSSWVLIKIGLKSHLPAITFAGLRYTLAFLILIPFVFAAKKNREAVKSLNRNSLPGLLVLGIVYYALTQGSQFLSLAFLPAATVSLFLNLTPVIVAVFSGVIINEKISPMQLIGVITCTAGVLIYFTPLNLVQGESIGLIAAAAGVLANSASSIMGRKINLSGMPPVVITFISMGTGAVILLLTGIFMQGTGNISFNDWLIIIWLAVINTAFAFWMWNHTLRTLTAVESSILNSTMLPQIAILAWVFLAEPLTLKQIAGMIFVGAGALIVQFSALYRNKRLQH